jgi:anthraniloyl-CoA monooxygenase
VIETDERTWRNFGFDKLSETEMLPVIERVFAAELEGHALIANRSLWRNFPTITNKTLGEGQRGAGGRRQGTAHFSIGSGTKLRDGRRDCAVRSFQKTRPM